ncbi:MULTISPECIES: energy transducer TonB [unclassified Pseudoxanthomonas]|uniref:energy transducer TonB n=1 Tax=unclassified Pseudoxanthomonas TaxID=2645906 RepID=UPI00160C9010|nr:MULTISPECIES: energy transducer TonB [unclassified Pseudoxanthomonas]MBB3276061.1 TonB family protein [Pseudoxanthomonas sp. OG2]MBV7472858.1 energy transducer TonB [Pseudoxanthomonas sp. PXM05]
MKGIWGIALWLLAALAQAQTQTQTAELRMPVNGEIGIDPAGSVFDYRIDSELTPEVKALVERSVRQWKFEPVLRGGVATHAKARMHLTLIAHQVDGGFQLKVEEARFSGYRKTALMNPPRYPPEAARAGISGDVLVAVRVDAQGEVVDAAAVQSAWPYEKISESAMRYWGKVLEKASVDAARKWRFEPSDPAQSEPADTTLVVPISFRVNAPLATAGWRQESAGPARPIPWLEPAQQAFDATGLKQGEALALDYSVKLKTPVVGTAL